MDQSKNSLLKDLPAPFKRRVNLQKSHQVMYDRDLFPAAQFSKSRLEVSLMGVAKDYLQRVPLVRTPSDLG